MPNKIDLNCPRCDIFLEDGQRLWFGHAGWYIRCPTCQGTIWFDMRATPLDRAGAAVR